jgi:hypothetical protein
MARGMSAGQKVVVVGVFVCLSLVFSLFSLLWGVGLLVATVVIVVPAIWKL